MKIATAVLVDIELYEEYAFFVFLEMNRTMYRFHPIPLPSCAKETVYYPKGRKFFNDLRTDVLTDAVVQMGGAYRRFLIQLLIYLPRPI